MGDELEQDLGFLVALFDVAEVVEDENTVIVELLQGVFEPELGAGDRALVLIGHLVDEVGLFGGVAGAEEQQAGAG